MTTSVMRWRASGKGADGRRRFQLIGFALAIALWLQLLLISPAHAITRFRGCEPGGGDCFSLLPGDPGHAAAMVGFASVFIGLLGLCAGIRLISDRGRPLSKHDGHYGRKLMHLIRDPRTTLLERVLIVGGTFLALIGLVAALLLVREFGQFR